MKYTFVGDIHGKTESVDKALSNDGQIVFVGDFIDSFDRSIGDHERCFKMLFKAIRQGKAQTIWGNHELSYFPVCIGEVYPHHRCSGYDYSRLVLMKKYEKQIRQYFKPFLFINKEVLVTHAGLTRQIWDLEKMDMDSVSQTLTDWWPVRTSPMHWIGRYRGGFDSVGGLFWCDFVAEFQPVPGLTQVFGHTARGGNIIRQVENSYCIDCLDKSPFEFLQLEI